LGNIFQELST